MLRNRGHDIMVLWQGDAGGIKINDVEYNLLQVHWHTPSEHTVNGTRFDMELHLVHNNSRGDIAVVGILYKLGRHDTFLQNFVNNLKSVTEEGIGLGVVDPWRIKFGGRKYFSYLGSLTVPPCTEGVLWTVLEKARTVSKDQLIALRDAVHDGFEWNSRPTQELKGRKERLAKLEANLSGNKDSGEKELLKLVDELQSKLEDMKHEHVVDKKEVMQEVMQLRAENEKLQYRIIHLVRALKDADSKLTL
ncbi:alpha carbonic anhydrase 4-like [Dorcoceras hygrometricum]|uniref:Carbonic anhydrase n=1 Tax=Dorcoceras hygrometricum TaxID=472368 RepID=A0A2Z7BUJ8_9LAMI|nr:alpha carbonic anhydrase 4-like [Dorcoceras hygrometricum]